MEHPPWMKMYFLFKMGIFHCYVCLPEGNTHEKNALNWKIHPIEILIFFIWIKPSWLLLPWKNFPGCSRSLYFSQKLWREISGVLSDTCRTHAYMHTLICGDTGYRLEGPAIPKYSTWLRTLISKVGEMTSQVYPSVDMRKDIPSSQ